MQHTIEIPSITERKLIINFEAEDVNKYIDIAVKRIGKDLSLDGFRKGKVPAKVIEGKFASDVQSQAEDALVNENVQKFLAQENLHPISRIQFTAIEGNEHTEVKRDTPYKFACSFEVLPPIELPQFADLSVEVPEVTLDPQAVEDFTRRIRQTGATLEEVTEERLPQDFDVCLIDVEGTFEGSPVPGMKGEGIHIQLNPNEDKEATKDVQVIVRTLKVGEEKTGKITVAEEYPDPTYRGQEIDMRVKLISISTEKLPEMDDAFALKFGLTDIDALHRFINDNVKNQTAQKIKVDAQTKLLDSILEKLDFDVPGTFLAAHKREYLIEARNFLTQQGQDPKEMNETLKRMEDEANEQATKQAKAQSFLLALAYREKVTISDNELQEYIYKIAQEAGQDPKDVLQKLYQSRAIDDVQTRLIAGKTSELLYAKVKKITVDKDGKPVEPKESTEAAE